MSPDYGESPDLIETRAKLAAARALRKSPLGKIASAVGLDGNRKRRTAREVHEAYCEIFYPDGATLSRAGAIVLDDLAEAAGLGAASWDTDHAELCILEGKRRLMLHLLSRFRLSPERAAATTRELENNR
ncbi:hypothetical protein [Novosphingobium sp. FKTRR1]|uniref:Bbp19 family protein n=1 Tax=Novosphingobium sp. FKTRR1 TaxID=2879118 RepID=UPI001CF066FD|nr:hypothetical protein [Novosphingobium sp. FKTRR1]